MDQESKEKRIGVIGLGGVGVCLAHGLKRIGYEPIGFARRPVDRFEVVTKGKSADFQITSYASITEDLKETFDLLMFCLKNHILIDVADDYLTLLKPDGMVLCAQNGLMEYFLASKTSEVRVLSAITTGTAEMVAPGRVLEPIPIHISVGAMSKQPDGGARELLAIFKDTAFSNTTDHALDTKWTKFLFSCVANPLSAITGMEADRLFRTPNAQRIGLGIVDEILRLAASIQVRPARMGPLDPTWLAQDSRVPFPLRRGILHILSFGLRGIRTSMLQDIERGKKTEIEFLNGWVVSEASKRGAEAPVNRRTVELVQELESGTRKASGENLAAYDGLL